MDIRRFWDKLPWRRRKIRAARAHEREAERLRLEANRANESTLLLRKLRRDAPHLADRVDAEHMTVNDAWSRHQAEAAAARARADGARAEAARAAAIAAESDINKGSYVERTLSDDRPLHSRRSVPPDMPPR